MADEQKPVATETPAVEQTPAITETPAAEPTAEGAPAATTETPAEEGAASADDKITKVEKPVEPIYSGALGYKAPGLVSSFRFSKKYFWFGEEPVSTQSLSQYLRGEKPEVAQPTAAWSSQTGKGLLYFVKHADQKATPAGVLNLAEASDLTKDGTIAFHFKLHGHKHAFEASTASERNGWYLATEKAIEEAKAQREEMLASPGYKEQLEKLGKPVALAAAGASTAKEATSKKSTEVKPADSAAPARTGSSSSEDADGKKKTKAKSRSLSRKRGSIFGSLLGGKKDEKAEEKKEEKKEDATPAGEPSVEATEEATAAVAAAPIPSIEGPSDETKVAEAPETTEPAAEASETPKTAPKPTKRGSIFGNFASKLRSPTSEKKEADIVPPVPAKDELTTETSAEAPKIEETPAPVVETPEAPKETTEETPKEEAKEEAHATTPTATQKSKRGSIFGNLTGSVKKEKAEIEGEIKTNKLTGLFRNASKAGKNKDGKKKDSTTPPKVEEVNEPSTEEAAKEEAAPTIEPTPAEPNSIGDVVPAAVTVGQAPKSTPEVSATA
ncbi:hypothetical protein AOQ84DRAFT_118694 [Glonium stellatum]|uniref:Meiotic expression up-regulated protein 6 PH domain-containing protein n=1 Tax=Glonium stellatum TaxID=574774 RepID=A0A8E2FAA7_9PEZI|nr:hypothetical protein AOQ84DRAFT_118694 [Glonium stellatum]